MKNVKIAQSLLKLAKELSGAGNLSSRDSIMEAIERFTESERGLRELIRQYDEHWAYGATADPVLQDMMEVSSELRDKAKKMLNELKARKAKWEDEAEKRV